MADLFTLAGMRDSRADLDAADIIIFNGGEDIGTAIYHERPLYGNIPEEPSDRDLNEIGIFNRFKGTDKLLVGICRGSQLLNCLNGGTLWQDVNRHNRDHPLLDVKSGKRYHATSTHHQMMRPNPETAELIATADESTRKDAEFAHYPFQTFSDDHKDAEIVWYKNTRSLCIQGHPEYVPGSIYANYCLDLILNYLKEIRNEA